MTTTEQRRPVDERADATLAFLRASGGFVATSTIRAALGYTNGQMGGVLDKLLRRGDVEREQGMWRARP